jgi:hypothetical protein
MEQGYGQGPGLSGYCIEAMGYDCLADKTCWWSAFLEEVPPEVARVRGDA